MLFDRVLGLFRSVNDPGINALANGDGEPLPGACDYRGNIFVRPVYSGGPGVEIAPVLIAYNADNIVPVSMIETGAFLYAYNPITLSADRVEIEGDDLDNLVTSVSGHLSTKTHNAVFNGTTWDRQRGNQDVIILASAIRAVTTDSADLTSYSSKGAIFVLDVTAVPGVQTLTFILQGKDIASGKYYNINTASVAVAAIGTYSYAFFPALFSSATGLTNNLTGTNGNAFLPRTYRVRVAHSGAGAFTYSVGAALST